MDRLARVAAHLSPPAAAAAVEVSPEVKAALARGDAVVALESTIISHGMPYPQNLETALRVEEEVRRGGAVPATVAILRGRLRVGLPREALEELARRGRRCAKVSRRDMAAVMALGEEGFGATTVAATMYAAHLAGVRVFVTGGVGGVHRGFERTMDVSADLTELGRTPVCVVCAGVKSVLDVPRTLEFLETQGVPVVTLGADEFPAFFTPHSGCRSPLRRDTPAEVAAIVHASGRLGLASGAIVAVPVPAAEAAAAEPVERATRQALDEAREKGVEGREVTPFLLARISELTGGDSLRSNIALVLNNARCGAAVAVELARLAAGGSGGGAAAAAEAASSVSPLVVGGINQDLLGRPRRGERLLRNTSNIGHVERQWGGVGRNIAECLARLGAATPRLVSAVGDDGAGRAVLEDARRLGIDTAGVAVLAGAPTSSYMAVFDERGELLTTVADMEAVDAISPATMTPEAARWLGGGGAGAGQVAVVDANLQADTVTHACAELARAGVAVLFEPVGVTKSVRGLDALRAGHVACVTPSENELAAMAGALEGAAVEDQEHEHAAAGDVGGYGEDPTPSLPLARRLPKYRRQAAALFRHGPGLRHAVVTLGADGVLLASRGEAAGGGAVVFRHYAAPPLRRQLANTSGAGDSLVGGLVWAALRAAGGGGSGGDPMAAVPDAVPYGMLAARETIESLRNVSDTVTAARLEAEHRGGSAVAWREC